VIYSLKHFIKKTIRLRGITCHTPLEMIFHLLCVGVISNVAVFAAEHTLVPTRRDHGFSVLFARWGVGSLVELVCPQLAWRHSLVFGGK